MEWTKEQAIKALNKAKSEARPNSWGMEDDGYWEYIGELDCTIEDIEENNKDVNEALSDISFNPAKYL